MKKVFMICVLVCALFVSSAQAQINHKVLSAPDIKTYKQIFEAHKKGQFKTADDLTKKLKNKSLMGYVLYDKYFSPKYKTKPSEITSWLNKYSDLPVASDIYALGKQKKATLPKSKPKDIFGGKSSACTYVLRSEPIDLISNRLFSRYSGEKQKQARTLMNKIARHIRSGNTKNARDLIESKEADKLFNQEELDSAKTALAFSYFLDGEDEKALSVAQDALKTCKNTVPLAAWTAGLVSWRMGNTKEAAEYFEIVADGEKTYPLLRASSAFWAARAHLALGNYDQVGDYLELSSEYPRTFYGFLSMRLLSQDLAHMWESPTSTEDEVTINFSHPGLSRFFALRQVGKTELSKKELAKLYVEADKDAKGVLMLISEQNGFAEDLRGVTGNLSGDEDARFPAPNWTPKDGWKVDKALVYAFVKQESCFNVRAESSVGALGLMQIMPGTGKELARTLQYPWNTRKLKEPAYNLSLGQNYLLQLMENPEVNYNLIFTAVSYNAGPGNLAKWKKRMNYQNDPLLFIESIPSKETRSFVERIMVNYWVYRSLMGQPVSSLDDVSAGKWAIYRSHDGKK